MIPVVTGTGRRTEIGSDDYERLILLPELSEIDPRLLDLYDDPPLQADVSWMMTSRP